VHQKHQAGFSELARDWHALRRAKTGAVKGLFQIDLRTHAGKAGHAPFVDFYHDAVAVPPVAQRARLDEHVALVCRVQHIRRNGWHAQPPQVATVIPDRLRMGQPALLPASHSSQLDAPDGRLHLDHPPVGTEAFVHPAEARRMVAFVNRRIGLAVVFVRPHLRPEISVVCRDHTAFAACGHDLVLTERPGADMAERTDRAAVDTRAVSLGTVLDYPKAVLPGEAHYGRHVARPSGEMDANDCARSGSQGSLDGTGTDVLAVTLDIGEHRRSSHRNDAGRRGQKRSGGDDDFIAYADAERA